MGKKINPMKTSESSNDTQIQVQKKAEGSKREEMQNKMRRVFMVLQKNSDDFQAEEAFKELQDYIKSYERILYTMIFDVVYDISDKEREREKEEGSDRYATLLTNIDKLIDYSDSMVKRSCKNSKTSEETDFEDTRKAVYKICDHVNLARRQYSNLKQSDDEFNRRVQDQTRKSQETLMKEMNSQLLSIVGIFTALAFVLFGGISSLSSIFEGLQETHLLKLLILGCGWGLGMLNVVFIFLFCIGKMTKLNFKSTLALDASFWQRYPVVCWTNFLMCFLLAFLSWLYYCVNRHGGGWLDWLISLNPMIVTIAGCVLLIIFFVFGFLALKKATKAKVGDEDE